MLSMHLKAFILFSVQYNCNKRKVVNKNAFAVYTSVICLTAISGVFLLLYMGLHCYMTRFQLDNLALGASQIWLFIEFFEIYIHSCTSVLTVCLLYLRYRRLMPEKLPIRRKTPTNLVWWTNLNIMTVS